jgi:hypothetical protein
MTGIGGCDVFNQSWGAKMLRLRQFSSLNSVMPFELIRGLSVLGWGQTGLNQQSKDRIWNCEKSEALKQPKVGSVHCHGYCS